MDVVQMLDAPTLKDSIGISMGAAARTLKAVLEWRQHRTGMLTSNVAEAGGFIKSQASEATPDLQLHFVVAKIVNHARTLLLGHGVSCHVCVLRPLSRGSIRLASKDPLAAPLIDPNFLAEPDDLQRMIRGFRLMREILQQPAIANLGAREAARSALAQSDQEIEQFIRNFGDTIYHPVGSCRMGNGAMDVVDAQLRVHGVQGLRVVDASIMPRIVSGNTHAPTVMIAEKAADMIKVAG
jgi:choline dehydrogenase-like flavoprotein